MDIKSLILIRDFLFKTFIIGLVFAIIFFVITIKSWDFASTFVYSMFQINQEELGKLVLKFFLCLRFYLVFVLLVPALGLHWVIKSQKK